MAELLRFHLVASTDAGEVHEYELSAVDAGEAALMAASQLRLSASGTVTHMNVRHVNGGAA